MSAALAPPGGPCVVINKFVVPDEALDAFLGEFAAHRAFLAAQPGFLRGALYRKSGGPGRYNIVNVAFWETAAALQKARDAMGAHYAQSGADPGGVYRRLGVEADIATYTALEDY